MIIVTTLIYQKNRIEEILTCIRENLQHTCIEGVVCFLERTLGDGDLYKTLQEIHSVDVQVVYTRPSVHFMLAYMNKHHSNKVCIVTNSDISFHSSIQKVKKIDFNKCNLALTRYNILAHTMATSGDTYPGIIKVIDGITLKTMFHHGASTDSWFFKLSLIHI